jgi:hypothetical protein
MPLEVQRLDPTYYRLQIDEQREVWANLQPKPDVDLSDKVLVSMARSILGQDILTRHVYIEANRDLLDERLREKLETSLVQISDELGVEPATLDPRVRRISTTWRNINDDQVTEAMVALARTIWDIPDDTETTKNS